MKTDIEIKEKLAEIGAKIDACNDWAVFELLAREYKTLMWVLGKI